MLRLASQMEFRSQQNVANISSAHSLHWTPLQALFDTLDQTAYTESVNLCGYSVVKNLLRRSFMFTHIRSKEALKTNRSIPGKVIIVIVATSKSSMYGIIARYLSLRRAMSGIIWVGQ
jgi:hypothetical protein